MANRFDFNLFICFLCRIFQKYPDIKSLWQNPRIANNAATTAGGDDADAPNTANRWKMDLRNHGSKFFNSLDDLISVVDKPEELFKMLHDIGLKHKGYEVKPEHIQVIQIQISFKLKKNILLLCVLIGYCRWSQSYNGIWFKRKMDRYSTEILWTINKYYCRAYQSSVVWWRKMTSSSSSFSRSRSFINLWMLLASPSACYVSFLKFLQLRPFPCKNKRILSSFAMTLTSGDKNQTTNNKKRSFVNNRTFNMSSASL